MAAPTPSPSPSSERLFFVNNDFREDSFAIHGSDLDCQRAHRQCWDSAGRTTRQTGRLLRTMSAEPSFTRLCAICLDSSGRNVSSNLAERTGLEPATPGVTGRYSNQLNYRSRFLQRFLQHDLRALVTLTSCIVSSCSPSDADVFGVP